MKKIDFLSRIFIAICFWGYFFYKPFMGEKVIKCPTDTDKKEIPLKYQAVIIKKYFDSTTLGRIKRTIRLYNKDQRIIELISSRGEWWYGDDLWEKTNVGDSVYKFEGSLDLYILDGGWDTTIIQYKCHPDNIPNWK